MTELIDKIRSASSGDEVIAANAALVEHRKSYGNYATRKKTYTVKVSGKHYQIEVGSGKKYMTAEVRNKHLRLNKINEGLVNG